MKRFWLIIGGSFLFLGVIGLAFPKFRAWEARGRQVAWVPIHGPILDVSRTLDWIKEIEKKPVRAVFLHIESPGGTVGGSQALYFALKHLKAQKNIPVVAYIPSIGASGAYYVAAAADRIVAQPGAVVGSIGVIAQIPEYYELGEKIGIRMRTFKAGSMKDAGNPWRPMTPQERSYMEHLLNALHEQFIQHVGEGRGLSNEALRPYADGRVFTGQEAAQVGLVDLVGSFAEAESLLKSLADISGDPIYVYPPQPRKPLLRRLVEGMVGRIPHSSLDMLNFKPYPQVLFLWTGF